MPFDDLQLCTNDVDIHLTHDVIIQLPGNKRYPQSDYQFY